MREPRRADVEAAVFVDGGDGGGSGDVEGRRADLGHVGEREGAGDEGGKVRGLPGAGLQVAPLGAVSVGC